MQNHINVGSHFGGGRQISKSDDPESLSPGKAAQLQSACEHADASQELECKDSFDQIDNGLLMDNEIPGFSTDQRVPCFDIESFNNNDDSRIFASDLKNELTVGVQLDLNYSEISVFGGQLQTNLHENAESKMCNCFDGSNLNFKFQCNDNNIGSINPEQLLTDFDNKLDFSAGNCVSLKEIEYLNEDISSLEEMLDGDDFNENKESGSNRNDLQHSLNERAVIDEIIDDLIDNQLPKDSAFLVPVKQGIDEAINSSSSKIVHTDNETYNEEPSESNYSIIAGNHLSSYSSTFFTQINSKVDYANVLQDATRDNIINEHIDHFKRLETLSTAMHNSRQLLDFCSSVIPVSKFPSIAESISFPLPTQQKSVFSAAERESEDVSYLEADRSKILLCHEILEDSANQDELVSNDHVDLNDMGSESSDKNNVSEVLVNNLPELSINLFFNSFTENESKESVQCHESSEVCDECQIEIDNIESDSCVKDIRLESNTGKAVVPNDGYLLVLPINRALLNSDLCDCSDSVNFEKVTESSYVAKCLIDKLLDSIVDTAQIKSNRMFEQKIDEAGGYNTSTESNNLKSKTEFNFVTTIDSGETKLEAQSDENKKHIAIPEKDKTENLALETVPAVIDKESISANEAQLFTAIEDQNLSHHGCVKSGSCAEEIVDVEANYLPESDSGVMKCYAVGTTLAGSHVGVSDGENRTDSSDCAENQENEEKFKNEKAKADQDWNENYLIGMNHKKVVEENPCQCETKQNSNENTEKTSIVTCISNDVLLATDQNHSLLNETSVKISDLKQAEHGTSIGFDSVNLVIDISRSLPCDDSTEDDHEGEDKSKNDKNDLLEDSSGYGENETRDSSCIRNNMSSNLENYTKKVDISDFVQPSQSETETASNSWLSKSLSKKTVTFNFDIKSADDNCCVNSFSHSSNYDLSIKNQECLPEQQLTIESGDVSIKNKNFFPDEQLTIELGESSIKEYYDIVKLGGSANHHEDKEKSRDDKEDIEKADGACDGGGYLKSLGSEVVKESFILESQMAECSKEDSYESDSNNDCEVNPKIGSLASALEHRGDPTVNMKKRKHTGDDVDKNCLEVKKNRVVPLSGFAEVPDFSECDAVSHDEDESMYKEDESFITKTPLWKHKPWQDVVELRSPEPISTLSAFEEGVELSADMISKFKEFVEKESKQSCQALKTLEPCKKPLRIGLSRKYKGPHLHKHE